MSLLIKLSPIEVSKFIREEMPIGDHKFFCQLVQGFTRRSQSLFEQTVLMKLCDYLFNKPRIDFVYC